MKQTFTLLLTVEVDGGVDAVTLAERIQNDLEIGAAGARSYSSAQCDAFVGDLLDDSSRPSIESSHYARRTARRLPARRWRCDMRR